MTRNGHRTGIDRRRFLGAALGAGLLAAAPPGPVQGRRRLLYVATPGIRNYLEYGGHGVLVFDADDGHRLLRRIPARGLDEAGKPRNVKGICAGAATGRLYVSTTHELQCFDLDTDALLWERRYEAGCDRMSITPDGREIYLPSFEGPLWHVVDSASGDVLATIRPDSGAHNTVVGLDGRWAYLAGLKSRWLTVVRVADRARDHEVGPFSAPVRPFTVDGAQRRAYACVNDLLGFEVADLRDRKVLHRVEVAGFGKGPIKRHGCPSHGVGLTPDERELWLCDAHNQRLHVFDATADPPRQAASIPLRDEPGWVTFGLDGRYAYPSTGEVIEVATREVVARLADEAGAAVQSEKMVELAFEGGRVAAAADQFGLGRKAVATREATR
jgi:hypothetical protein